MWLNMENTTAAKRDELIEFGLCKEITHSEAYWDDNRVDNICYAETPVRVGDGLLFLKPNYIDLQPRSSPKPCGKKKRRYFRESQVHGDRKKVSPK
jgi:hypothetical protein